MAISSAPTNGAGSGEAFLHNAASTSATWTLAAAPSNGDVLYLLASAGQNTQDVTNVTQTGVTWTKVANSATTLDAVIWRGVAGPGAAAAITITSAVAGNTANIRGNVSVWSGSPQYTLGTVGSNSASATTAVSSGSLTPTAGRNVLLLVAVRAQNGGLSAPTGSFTALASGSTGYGFAYRVVASASGSYSTTYTQTSGTYETVLGVFSDVSNGTNPTATITSQSGYTSYDLSSGRSITFTGTGSDAEDGTLTGASLAWSSSIDGALGTGASVTTSSLSVGTHTITLTATDSSSLTGTATKTVVVKNAASWHLLKRNVPATSIGLGAFTGYMQVLVPASYNPATSYPLMMEIGGTGQRGTDNTTQMTDGYAATASATPSAFSSYGGIWVFPQFPALGSYGGREYAYPLIAAALAAAQAEWNIDTSRLYATGYSLGAQVFLESLYNASPAWAALLAYEGCVTNREGLLSGNDPAGTWTINQAAAEVAGRNAATVKIRQYQDDNDTNNTVANAQITRDAFFAVDPSHAYYNYLTTSGLGHVGAYQAAQADTTNLDWAFGITRGTGGGSDPNPTPPSNSNRHRRARRVVGVLL